MAPYDVALVVVGVALFGAVGLPWLLEGRAVSFPIAYVSYGAVVFALPLGLPAPDPLAHGVVTERLTELGVILSLMGAGLKLDRRPSLSGWQTTWRLLGITMPVTIGLAVLLGWWAVGLAPAAAVLLGAVIAPTDPVLAADVQVEAPMTGREDEVRFALTSEAGLNDGLAFPFTNMAVAIAVAGLSPEGWLVEWLLVDVGYKIVVGTLVGVGLGSWIGYVIFRLHGDEQRPVTRELSRAMLGSEALAATLVVYGVTELLGGYGFIAVFVAALSIRESERRHTYHGTLHEFAELSERLLMTVLLVFFGGALSTGLLSALTWEGALVAVALVAVVRPLAGIVGLLSYPAERNAIAFFGIRGIGSFYYLSYGLNHASFQDAETVWAIVGATVLLSVFVHGLTARPVMQSLDVTVESRRGITDSADRDDRQS